MGTRFGERLLLAHLGRLDKICDAIGWPECRDCPHYPKVSLLFALMEEQRPAQAPQPAELGRPDPVERCQMDAFEAQDADWWRYGEGRVLIEPDTRSG